MKYYSTKTINKKQLLFNYGMLKRTANKNICAVVKANAYGHGLKTVCNILKNCCDFFAVHNLMEAIQLRKINKTAKILVLGYCIDYSIAQKYNISVSIDDFKQLEEIVLLNKEIKVHLKINTGMNRFGIKKHNEFAKILKYIISHKNIIIEGIYTHCFDTKNEKITQKQLQIFKNYVKILKKQNKCIVHIGGSGMIHYKNLDYIDYVRVGIALFGYCCDITKPIMKIESKIIKIFSVDKNEYIGYDCYYKTKNKIKVAIVPFGYADGMVRQFQENMKVFINDKVAKIIGKICMDVFMVDISNIDAYVGDDVVVFKDASYWAQNSGLSEYEILTGLNNSRTNLIVE